MLFTISACRYDESYKLAATYDFENRQCNIANISKITDYKELKVTVVVNGKDNFSKEITYDIETLKSGETYIGDLSYFSENTEVSNVYIKSYEYYQNDVLLCILVGVLVVLLIVRLIIAILED